jgi:hypothetical protein
MSPESINHRKKEITSRVTTTTIVKLVTSSLVGQVTFFNSSFDSRTYTIILRTVSRILFTLNLRLRFLVNGMFIAKLTVLLNFKLAGLVFLVLGQRIILSFTFLACQQYDFTHMLFLCL